MGSRSPIDRRRFMAGTAAAVAGGRVAWPGAAAADAELGRARSVSIFHTTDLHGRIVPTSSYEGLDDVGGLARCATCIRQWRRDVPHSITVDVGDVVQGTPESLRNGGVLMIDLLNRLGYDAWTLGNHDFDWGPERTEAMLAASAAPVLTANVSRGGRPAGDSADGWKRVRPWTIREVGGFKLGLIGLITPGLPFWLPPETLGGTEATDPGDALRRMVAEVRGEGADAVVVLGHMGYRFNDDYANPVRTILRDAKGVDCYLAGHSHQDQPSWMMHDVLCSQASYHGIHCGRLDLTFDLDTRKLVDRRAYTLLMDDRFALDPLVMEVSRGDREAAEADMQRHVATVTRVVRAGGRGSELVRLFCECFAAALAKQGTRVDGVFHGSFGSGDIRPGPLTVGDCWRLMPFENQLVTAEVTGLELARILAEDRRSKDSDRTLWPFEVATDAEGAATRIMLRGSEVGPEQRFTIAFNGYDAQSGGRRMMGLREILTAPAARRLLSPIDTRSALIDGLLDRGEV